MKWSTYQTDIFDFVETGFGNAIVEAVAGSGKTTTIVEAIKRIPESHSSIFLAFNKSIAEELKSRGVNAKTFHSLCCGAAMRAMGANGITTDKLSILMRENFTKDENYKYGSFVIRLVGLAKQVGVGCLVPDIEQIWYAIVDHHDLELEKEDTKLSRALEIASELLTLNNSAKMIDFDDMLYIPVLKGIKLPTYFFLFVDEAQDTNGIQRAILRKLMGPKSRMVAVGDPAQAIYGFRGADSNSLNKIAEDFNCIRFPLSVSYRCGKKIVEHSRRWVSHILPADNAADGQVVDLGNGWELDLIKKEDLVVCRTTKPLLFLAFKMLRARMPVTVMGREIGTGLVKFIQDQKTNEIQKLIDSTLLWEEREVEKAMAKMDESKAAAVQDKASCIIMLAEEIEQEEGDVNSLISVVKQLFDEKQGTTKLATIHKAKGLEADSVFWLNSSNCPSKWARQPWQKTQEDNLCYVATTRAKDSLYLIELDESK